MTNLARLSLSHYGQYLGPKIECGFVDWMIWALKWKVREPILTMKINFGFESRFRFKSCKIKEFNFIFYFHQWNVTIQKKWFNFKIYGYMNQCLFGKWVNLGKDTRVNIDSKMRTKSQGWRSELHSHSSSISLNEKLANLSKIWNWSS